MDISKLSGAKKALLSEYRKALDELIELIKPIDSKALIRNIENNADQPDSVSIQVILSHVYTSIFSYSIYIENSIGVNSERPEKEIFDTIDNYIHKINDGFKYCEQLFIKYPTINLEEVDPSKKINTSWGQQYDVEQLMEHAIVHILRHRRQIENIIGKQLNT